jgi:hypothetical protein
MRAAWSILGAAALGAASALAVAPIALWDMGPLPRTATGIVVRDGWVWHVVERSNSMVRWVNLETEDRLVDAQPDDGVLPWWAEPGPRNDLRATRTATVVVGWPLPAMACRWSTGRNDANFPPPATNDDSGWAPKDAVRRMVTGDPAGARSVLLPQFAVDALVLGCGWAALAALLRRGVRRLARRGVTPPG